MLDAQIVQEGDIFNRHDIKRHFTNLLCWLCIDHCRPSCKNDIGKFIILPWEPTGLAMLCFKESVLHIYDLQMQYQCAEAADGKKL